MFHTDDGPTDEFPLWLVMMVSTTLIVATLLIALVFLCELASSGVA